MTVVLLMSSPDANPGAVEVQRVSLRDRVVARLFSDRLDRRLAAGVPPEASAPLSLRARRLIDPATARRLARAVQRALDDARFCQARIARIPVRRRAVRDAAADLEAVARRLSAPAPLGVQGVAQVGLLLSDGCGPLYSARAGEDLRSALRRARAALEVP
jgi:hypothetical protein